MEFFAVIAVIVVLALVLGIKPIFLIVAATILLWLIFASIALLFFYFFFRLLTSKKAVGFFSHIEKNPKNKFKSAYYTIDDNTYPNVFPEEGLFRNILYKPDKPYKLRLNSRGYVFDKFAFTTCCIGFTISILFVAATIILANIFLI